MLLLFALISTFTAIPQRRLLSASRAITESALASPTDDDSDSDTSVDESVPPQFFRTKLGKGLIAVTCIVVGLLVVLFLAIYLHRVCHCAARSDTSDDIGKVILDDSDDSEFDLQPL